MSYIAKNGRLYTSGASEALTLLDDKFSVNKSYSKGDSCIYNDYLWKFTSDKPAGEWNPSVVEQCRVMDFVDDANGRLTQVQSQIHTNLLNPTAPTQTVNGVTCTNNGDGTYTVNGTASNNVLITFFIINDTNLSVSTFQNSKLVGCPKGGSDGTYFISCDLNHDGTWVKGYPDIGNGVIVSNIPSDTDRLMATIVIRKGVTCNNLTFKPMLTTDLSATYDDFVPYTGDSGRLNEDVSDVNRRLTQVQNQIVPTASIESGETASKAYSKGDFLVKNGSLYKVTNAIVKGDTLTVGANIVMTTVSGELSSIKSNLTDKWTFTKLTDPDNNVTVPSGVKEFYLGAGNSNHNVNSAGIIPIELFNYDENIKSSYWLSENQNIYITRTSTENVYLVHRSKGFNFVILGYR